MPGEASRRTSLHGETAGVRVDGVRVWEMQAAAPMWWVVGRRLVGDRHVDDGAVLYGGHQYGLGGLGHLHGAILLLAPFLDKYIIPLVALCHGHD